MKRTILAGIVVVCVAAWIAGVGDNLSAAEQKKVAERLPNSGPVDNEEAALQIGKLVLGHLLTPDDFRKKVFAECKVKNGIWTVTYWEPKTRINFPIVIQIRQKTGSIIKYEDPNA